MVERNMSGRDKKFVESMLATMDKKATIEPESKAPPVADVEKLTDSIRRKIQRGE